MINDGNGVDVARINEAQFAETHAALIKQHVIFFRGQHRITQHYAVTDYDVRRLMYRVTIQGDKPV